MVTPVSSSPAMIARSTGAAPRQRGSSDGWTFSQRWRSSSVARDQPPVGDEHDRLGVEQVVEALDDRQAELHRLQLRRRRPQAAPAAGRRVGLGEHERDLVPRRQPLEDVGAERRARGEAEPRRHPRIGCGRSVAIASRRASGVVRSRISDAVEVVELVLDDPRVEALELEPERRARRRPAPRASARVPLDRHEHALQREAALVVGLALVARRRRSAG